MAVDPLKHQLNGGCLERAQFPTIVANYLGYCVYAIAGRGAKYRLAKLTTLVVQVEKSLQRVDNCAEGDHYLASAQKMIACLNRVMNEPAIKRNVAQTKRLGVLWNRLAEQIDAYKTGKSLLQQERVLTTPNPLAVTLSNAQGDFVALSRWKSLSEKAVWACAHLVGCHHRYVNHRAKQLTDKVIRELDLCREDNRPHTDKCIRTAQKITRLASDPAQYTLLQRLILAAQYRMDRLEPSSTPRRERFTEQLISRISTKLIEMATEWKSESKSFRMGEESKLNTADRAAIDRLCSQYPELAHLLLKDSSLRLSFFTWAMQDGVDVDSFALFPVQQNMLNTYNMGGAIGRKNNPMTPALRIEEVSQNNRPKALDLTLPFQSSQELTDSVGADRIRQGKIGWHTTRLSILDINQEIVLPGFVRQNRKARQTYHLTIREVFNIFKSQVESESGGEAQWAPMWHEYNYERGGITAINIFDMKVNGTPIDIDHISSDDLFNALPGFELISVEEARRRYKPDPTLLDANGQPRGDIEANRPFFVACGGVRPDNKEHPRPQLAGHGYMQLGIPEGDHFKLYTIGKYPRTTPGARILQMPIPTQLKHGLKSAAYLNFLTNTVPAVISLIDEARIKRFRCQLGYAFAISDEELKQVKERIHRDMKLVRSGHFLFNFAVKNCSEWVQDICNEVFGHADRPFPNLFGMRVPDVIYPAPISYFVDKKTPKRRIHWMAWLVGSGRSMKTHDQFGRVVSFSMANSKEFKGLDITLPGRLAETVDQDTGRLREIPLTN